MKVVLFCGGLGMRIRGDNGLGQYANDGPPKPMLTVGGQPLLWHLMRWYAEHGHSDFVLCLGYGATYVKDWIMDAGDAAVVSRADGADTVELQCTEMRGWTCTFSDTGLHTSVGQRLAAVRWIVEGDDLFLANYADGLADADLPAMIDEVTADPSITAAFLAVPPPSTMHVVQFGDGTRVQGVLPMATAGHWVNGGFFIMRPSVFDSLGPDEDLVEEPFNRMARAGNLLAFRHSGFWRAMDTFKDRAELEALWECGHRPWATWETKGVPG